MGQWSRFAVLIAVALSLVGAAFVPLPQSNCGGCDATGGVSNSETYGNYSIEISAEISDGICPNAPPPCGGSPCSAEVTREWVLPSGTSIDHCVLHNSPPPLCEYPPPTSGAQPGSSVRDYRVTCGDTSVFSAAAWVGTHRMHVLTTITCTECQAP